MGGQQGRHGSNERLRSTSQNFCTDKGHCGRARRLVPPTAHATRHCGAHSKGNDARYPRRKSYDQPFEARRTCLAAFAITASDGLLRESGPQRPIGLSRQGLTKRMLRTWRTQRQCEQTSSVRVLTMLFRLLKGKAYDPRLDELLHESQASIERIGLEALRKNHIVCSTSAKSKVIPRVTKNDISCPRRSAAHRPASNVTGESVHLKPL